VAEFVKGNDEHLRRLLLVYVPFSRLLLLVAI
jgi:hypothetical protein